MKIHCFLLQVSLLGSPIDEGVSIQAIVGQERGHGAQSEEEQNTQTPAPFPPSSPQKKTAANALFPVDIQTHTSTGRQILHPMSRFLPLFLFFFFLFVFLSFLQLIRLKILSFGARLSRRPAFEMLSGLASLPGPVAAPTLSLHRQTSIHPFLFLLLLISPLPLSRPLQLVLCAQGGGKQARNISLLNVLWCFSFHLCFFPPLPFGLGLAGCSSVFNDTRPGQSLFFR